MPRGRLISYALACSVLFVGLVSQAVPAFAVKQTLSDLKQKAESHPNDADTQFNLGLIYYQRGQFSESVPPLKRAVDLNPRDETALVLLGNVYLQLNSLS